jgi:drug/metabolite transporter (DMT)-like permease
MISTRKTSGQAAVLPYTKLDRPAEREHTEQEDVHMQPALVDSTNIIAFIVSACLAAQGAAFVLLRPYLRSDTCDSVVLMYSEALKLLCSVLFSWHQYRLYLDTMHMAIWPVITYGVMNLLSFYSLPRLPAALAIVIIQLKIVFTPIFARIFLKRALLTPRTFALSALVFACISITRYGEALRLGLEIPDRDGVDMLAVGGLVLETALSGLMCVYMQNLFEMTPLIMWRRNVQLAAFSTVFYMGVATFNRECATAHKSWLSLEWNALLLALLSACGGILVALSILFAGAVGKVVATSSSIALTVFAEALLVNHRSPDVLLSSLCLSALNAVIMYSVVS